MKNHPMKPKHPQLFSFVLLLFAASTAIAAKLMKSNCIRMQTTEFEACLYQDQRLIGEKGAKYWRTGESEFEFLNSILKVTKRDKIVFKIKIEPRARISLDTINKLHRFLFVTEDLTQDAGSYNGLLTRILSFDHKTPEFEKYQNGDEVVLSSTGKSEWKQIPDGFFQISCQPDWEWDSTHVLSDPKFRTGYIFLYRTEHGWKEDSLIKQEYWENNYDPTDLSDTTFDASLFPKTPSK